MSSSASFQSSSVRNIFQDPLGRRLLGAILLCSSLLALIATAVQLFIDYRYDVSQIEYRMQEIDQSRAGSIAVSMWNIDMQQVQVQLDGIARLSDISFVELKTPADQVLASVGVRPKTFNSIKRDIRIVFLSKNGESNFLGTLSVVAGLEGVYQRLADKTIVILIMQTIKTFTVAIFIIFIFNAFVSRHLFRMADYTRRLDIDNLNQELVLPRNKKNKSDDVLDELVLAINGMRSAIRSDIEKLQQMKETLRENEHRYRQLVDMSPNAIMIEHEDKLVFINQRTLHLFGATDPNEILGKRMLDFVPHEWRDTVYNNILNAGNVEATLRPSEEQIMRLDGGRVDVEVSRALFQYQGHNALQIVVHDIAKHKNLEEQLRKQALYDSLTELPNRTLLMDRISRAITIAERDHHRFFVALIDFDQFKLINDSFGHNTGDELLRTIARRMAHCRRKTDTLARLGGDEFVLILETFEQDEGVLTILNRIRQAICQPLMLHEQEIMITCSVGYCAYPEDGTDPSTLLKCADTAMYSAKTGGRDAVHRYQPAMQALVNTQLVMASRLRRALEREEFLLHYQPQVDLRTGQIVGVEALIRWQDSELGLVPPVQFIPLAEELGLIEAIGDWVIQTASRQVKAWQASGLPAIRVAVNLSAKQLMGAQLDQRTLRFLQACDLAPEFLEFELTESVSMNNPEVTIDILSRFNEKGIRVAIDDFGTGYSNLSYLSRFPIDRIKIDRTFVWDMAKYPNVLEITRSVISMAHGLRLKVVAEGVETQQQLQILVEFGCDEIQGYYFSKPLLPDACAEILRSGKKLVL